MLVAIFIFKTNLKGRFFIKCNYCHRRPTIVVKTKHEAVNFDMYLCTTHSKEEIVYLNSKYKSKVDENNAVIK